MREALILAGGRGTRLGAMTETVPKPLTKVGGVPFIDHVLWNLERHGIERVVLSVGYLAEAFEDYVSARAQARLTVEVVAEPEPLGTGGALALASKRLSDDIVLVLNGDTLFDLNYLDLGLMVQAETPVAIALTHVDDARRYGTVHLEGDRIAAFREKDAGVSCLISGGVYAVSADLLAALPADRFSLEDDLFPRLAAERRLAGRSYDGLFVDMGTPESLQQAQEVVSGWRDRPAVLFDRDGVLNVDAGHVATAERFRWIPGAREAVKMVNDAGALAIVVTNQAGIAKGMYSERDYLAFERWISEGLAEVGAHIDATYHCPHHPEGRGEFRMVCDCRKPAPGMVLAAISEWSLDPKNVVLIGDSESDLKAARAAGVRGVLFDGGDLRETVSRIIREPGVPT